MKDNTRPPLACRGVNIAVSVLLGVAVFAFIISFSIGLPIINRWFYYVQIGPLGLEEASGHTAAEIREAFDQIMDYLLLPGREFGAGVFRFSEEGAAHFADCKFLFVLDVAVAGASFGIIALILVLHFTHVVKIGCAAGHSAAFWAAICALVVPIVLVGLVASDFDRAFEVFHQIFFPGKDNWLFDPRTDEIITVLPEQFFMNCAIFIGCGLVFFSGITIAADCIVNAELKKKRRQYS